MITWPHSSWKVIYLYSTYCKTISLNISRRLSSNFNKVLHSKDFLVLFQVIFVLSAVLLVCHAAPAPKDDDLKTESSYALGYTYPYNYYSGYGSYGGNGYYPYTGGYGYNLGYGLSLIHILNRTSFLGLIQR